MAAQSQYEEVGEVSGIYFYPVKSCQGISVQSARNTYCGLVYQELQDRCFTFCKADGRFLGQMHAPKLSLIETSIPEPGVVVMRGPNMPDLKLNQKSSENKKKITVKLLGRAMEVDDCGDEAASWINKFLDMEGVRIVVSLPDISNKTECLPKSTKFQGHNEKHYLVSFQNRTPLLVTCEESVEDIKSKVGPEIQVANFRPNILGRGCKSPFDEDNWEKVKIGSCHMHSMWLNERCKITTVSLEKGEFRKDGEPLKTLHSYRDIKEHKMPILGINCGVDVEGMISVGDKIHAVRGEVV